MSAAQYPGGARFRLRFMLQEFELQAGDTLIGRSNECHITLFDPLISRHHARIRVLADQAVLEDLGSRNGCRVNGISMRGSHTLMAGDRIRIGKHEFVFGEYASGSEVRADKQTGSLVFCAACDAVYSRELGMCPNCGSHHALDEDMRLGGLNEQGKQRWAIDLLLQLANKAMDANGAEDADRVMRQLMSTLEGHLTNGFDVEKTRLDAVARAGIRLSDLQDDGFWARWVADLHVRAGLQLPHALTEATARWDAQDPSTAQQ
jgi:hypothetical protein